MANSLQGKQRGQAPTITATCREAHIGTQHVRRLAPMTMLCSKVRPSACCGVVVDSNLIHRGRRSLV